MRLSDILRSMYRLEELLASGYGALEKDWTKQSAAVRELEIIGEAAGSLSPNLRNSTPDLPWKQMRGFSSFAKHEYWRVDPKLVWTALQEIPRLRKAISRLQGVP